MSESADAPLIRPSQKPKKSCCASFCRCLCCCFFKIRVISKQLNPREVWAKKFTGLSNEQLVSTYDILLKLFSHENAIEALSGCRINPIFTMPVRNDLEFYVPQIWQGLASNIMLFGDIQFTQELIKVILEASKASFHFSHKLFWFLISTNFHILVDQPSIDPMQQLLHSLVSSIELISSENKLYVQNGNEITTMLVNLGIASTHRHKSSFSDVIEEEQPEVALVREIIQKYNYQGDTDIDVNQKIDPRYIPLTQFPMHDEMDGYHSTIWFYECLTDIGQRLLGATNKLELLKELLRDINRRLPAAVYIPFSSQTPRSCSILHIPISEVKVYSTKERAPYLICLEIFKPYDEFLQNLEIVVEEDEVARNASERSFSAPSLKRSTLLDDFDEVYPEKDLFEGDAFQSLMKQAAQKSSVLNISQSELEKKKFLTEIPAERYSQIHYSTQNIMDYRNSIAAIYDVTEEEKLEENVVFKESSHEQEQRLRQRSPFGFLNTWQVIRLIVKSGDDLRQEQFAMQLISLIHQAFIREKLSLWLYAYDIIATGPNCGILECVLDAVSIDGLKKALPPNRKTLIDFFNMSFGSKKSKLFKSAKSRFMNSLAAYSIVCYVLQIKDRHNGNILIDRKGRIVHIDFGFLLSNSPGGNMNFEKAPFKLTDDFEGVLGGRRSKSFIKFRALCVKGFLALTRISQKLTMMVEMMRTGIGASLPCFIGGEDVARGLRQRLAPRPNMDEGDYKEYVNHLIDESLDNWHTRCYDRCQYCCQNIVYQVRSMEFKQLINDQNYQRYCGIYQS